MKRLFLILLFAYSACLVNAQVHYGSVATYGLRKISTTYTGSAIQIRRGCDNATVNIGFTSCGDLDTTTLKNFVLVPNPLSAISSTAAAAYSLRRLNCSYAGSAIQIRRSSDNATVNVGFTTSGDLDTATMKTFVGVNSAFITIWFDQSGNARDASQTTTANQPRIMNAGVVEYCNSRPSIRFLGLGNTLATANFTAWTSTGCFNGVARVNTNLTFNAFVSKTGVPTNNNFPGPFDFYNASHIVGNGTTANFFATSQTFNVAQGTGIWTWRFGSAAQTASLNGASILSGGASATFSDQLRPLNIGARNDGLTGLNGWCSEVITFSVNPSTTDIKYIEWSQSVYYSVNGPVLLTLPAGAQSASVATWYDQSGNGINLQATGSRQPLIVNTGRVIRLGTTGTWPAVQGTNALQTNLTATFATAYTGNVLTINTVLRSDINTTGNLRVVSVGNGALTSADYNSIDYFNINQRNNNDFRFERNSIINPSTTFVVGSQMILTGRFNGLVRQLFNNGTGSGTQAETSNFNFNSLRLLQSINPAFEATEALTGKMSEFGLYYSSLSTTRRALIESNQSAYYNITPLTNNKYTPPVAGTYNRFVVGIGRESATDSVCATRQSAGMGFTCSTNAAAYLKDNTDFITTGINCPITSSTSVANISAPIQLRWQNDWYVDKIDFSANGGTVAVYFDFSDYGIPTTPGAAANYSLLNRPTTASNFTVVATAVANVSGDRVFFTVDAANLVDNSYFTIGSTNPPASPLPVELVSFNAEVCNADVCIDWKTASELNNDYFSIERSVDAENWNEIKRVKGAGTSQRTLSYYEIDYEPLLGISYYRLKQTDYDKNFKYSKVEVVEFKSALEVGIYPNPSSGSFNISNCKNYDKLVVTDVLGRKVVSMSVNKEFILLDLNALDSGSYFITLSNSVSGKKYTSKIVIDKK